MVGSNEPKRICKKAIITVNTLKQGLRKSHKNLVRIAHTGLECRTFTPSVQSKNLVAT